MQEEEKHSEGDAVVASLKDGESPVKIRRCRATVKPLLVQPECPPVSLDCSLRVKREDQQVPARGTARVHVFTLACSACSREGTGFFVIS